MNSKKVIINFIWKFMERTGVQIANLLIQMVLARLLMPEDFAAVAIVMVFIAIANIFVQSGLGTALIQSKDVTDEDYSTVFYTSLFISVLMIAIIYIAAPFIAEFYDMPILVKLVRWQSLIILTGSFNTVQQAVLSREMKFKKNFFACIIGCVASGIVSIICALNGLGIWSIIVLNVLNNVIYSVVLWILVDWRPKFLFSFNSMKRLFSFGWKLLVASLVGTVYDNLRTLIIGRVYPANQLAYYNRADVVSSSLMNGITGSISAVMLPVLSQSQDCTDNIKTMLKKTFQINCFICVPMMFGLAAVGEDLIVVLFSSTWKPAGLFLSIICVGYAFYPMHSANLQAIYAVGRSDIVLKLEIIKRVTGFILIVISIPFGIYPMTFSIVVMSILATLINAAPNKRLLKYSLFEQIKDIWIYFFMSGLMAVGVLLIRKILSYNIIINLSLEIIFGVIIYILLCIIFKPYAFSYFLRFVKKNE